MKLVLFASLGGDVAFRQRIVRWANSLSREHTVLLIAPQWLRPRGLKRSVDFLGFGPKWKRRFQRMNFSDWVIYNFGGKPSRMKQAYQHLSLIHI